MTNQETPQVLEATAELPIDNPTRIEPAALVISLEGVVYTVLAALVLLLNLLQLGIVPLTVDEVPRALAAWQAVQTEAEITVLADSALLQLAHMLSFTIFGSTEAAARVPTALVGFLLVFSPVLFRDLLGTTRTLVMTIVLACSPIVVAGSRLDSPVVWQLFFGILGLWALYRYVLTQHSAFTITSTVFFAVTLLLTGTTGYVTVLILVLSLVLAERLATNWEEEPSQISSAQVLKEWTWAPGLILSTLIVVIVSTGFMLYPAGFNALAQSVGEGLMGWVRPVDNAPILFGFLSSLIYEGVFWVFGLVAIYLIFNRDTFEFVDALFVAWLLVAALATIIYQGTIAAHALWLTLPLAGLVSYTIENALQNEDGFLWYQEADSVNNVFGINIPSWARWLITATSTLLFSLLLMQTGWLGRTLMTANFSVDRVDLFNSIAPPFFFVFVMLLLVVFAGFSFASLYGARETLRGGALGLLIVGLLGGLGTGWQITTYRADDPRELWHTRAIGEEAYILRDTLLDLSERRSEGFPALELTVVVDERNITENGIVAWTLRDFQNAVFVRDLSAARSEAVILTPPLAEDANLGGNYVGQSLVISRDWGFDSLAAQGTLAWWFQRSTRVPPQPAQEVVLWLRQDVYDGVENPALR